MGLVASIYEGVQPLPRQCRVSANIQKLAFLPLPLVSPILFINNVFGAMLSRKRTSCGHQRCPQVKLCCPDWGCYPGRFPHAGLVADTLLPQLRKKAFQNHIPAHGRCGHPIESSNHLVSMATALILIVLIVLTYPMSTPGALPGSHTWEVTHILAMVMR
jgi:hypothetical protein